MNRRDRRRSQRGQRRPPPGVLDAVARCPDCDSDVTVTQVAPGAYQGQVEHDDSCPWFARFQANGGRGVRLY